MYFVPENYKLDLDWINNRDYLYNDPRIQKNIKKIKFSTNKCIFMC